MNRRMQLLTFAAAFSFALLAGSLAFADFIIDWWTLDGGGELWTTGGDFAVSGSIAQPDASTVLMTGGDFELAGGFWPGALGVGPPVPGDCNGDHRVDLDDFEIFAACMAGPDNGVAPECSCANLDGDDDADLADFGRFQTAFTGG